VTVVELKPKARKTGIVTTVSAPRSTPTTNDIVEQIKAAMVSVGIMPPADIIVVHGKVQRFAIDTKKRDGWYVLFIHGTHVAGSFGSWRTGAKYKWRFDDSS
jgi:hypothetical protein